MKKPDFNKLNTKRVLNIFRTVRQELSYLYVLKKRWDTDGYDSRIKELESYKKELKEVLSTREHIER